MLVDGGDGVRGLVLLDALHARVGVEAHATAFLRALEQRQVHVGAVDHGVGVAEAPAKGLARLDAAHQGLVERIVHHHAVGVDGAAAGLLAHAQGIEGVEGVGAELDARANLADLGGLLEHGHVVALAHERQRCRQAADAAAGDDDREVRARRRHGGLLVGCGGHFVSILMKSVVIG